MNKNLDSDMQAVVDQLMKFNAPPIENLDYSNARAAGTGRKNRAYFNSDRATAKFSRGFIVRMTMKICWW